MSVRKATQQKTATPKRAAKPAVAAKDAVEKSKTPATKMTVEPVASAAPSQLNQLLKKRELVERVVERTGVKKSEARPVVEAVLAEFGEALAGGRELSVPPLGRVMINREKQIPDGRVFIVKIRQKNLPDVETESAGPKEQGTSEA